MKPAHVSQLSRATKLLALTTACTLLAGCLPSTSYLYRSKLTIDVLVDGEVKTGFSVVEHEAWQNTSKLTLPEGRGVRSRTTGEALYIDLGPTRRPLIALLTFKYNDYDYAPWNPVPEIYGWASDWEDGQNAGLAAAIQQRSARELSPGNGRLGGLPEFVTFADVTKPATVMKVDPANPAETLGPGVSIKRISFELVEPQRWYSWLFGGGTPLTTGIKTKLPWLESYWGKMLDGQSRRHIGKLATYANSLESGSFRRGFSK